MSSDAHSLREDLYRVLQHYADLAKLAKKGEVNPIGQIGRIVSQTAPYLLLIIKDLLPQLEKNEIDYNEALFQVITKARELPDVEILLNSRTEIQQIEQSQRVFLYGIKWLDSQSNIRPNLHEIEAMTHRLREFNDKYRKRYTPSETDTVTLIPYFHRKMEGETREQAVLRIADLVKRALLELHHLMLDHEPTTSFFFFSRPTRKEIEDDIMSLAWFLFRCGFTVDRIASGYYKDHLSHFLNEKLLDYLIEHRKTLDSIQGISTHLLVMCWLDFPSFYELSSDYTEIEDAKEIARKIKLIKQRKRKGWSLLKKLGELYRSYGSVPQGRLVQSFLVYRYYSSFGDYRGDHRITDPRGAQAVKLYKAKLDQSALSKKAEDDLAEAGRSFSSKTREEMSGLLKLLMDSLANPTTVKGKKVKVLGDISSGAMGKVCIGIFRNEIVALKKVKQGIASTLGDPVALLKYESDMHSLVQTPEQHPYVVEYFGLVEQDEEQLLINGYYPNDNLTQLVERNWLVKYKPPFSTESLISLATLEIIVNQLLECLRVFKAKGLVHRDLKTDNILYLVDENGSLNRLKVIDFGVGMAVGPGAVNDIFKGKVVGTFAYMAPEQAKGRSMFQSDLYSAGAIFTVLLTGKLPLVFPKTRTREELVQQILRIEREPRPKLVDLNPWLRKNTTFEHIAATVERMLDRDPLRRPTLEETQAAFDGVFQHIGQEKHGLSIFYAKG